MWRWWLTPRPVYIPRPTWARRACTSLSLRESVADRRSSVVVGRRRSSSVVVGRQSSVAIEPDPRNPLPTRTTAPMPMPTPTPTPMPSSAASLALSVRRRMSGRTGGGRERDEDAEQFARGDPILAVDRHADRADHRTLPYRLFTRSSPETPIRFDSSEPGHASSRNR